MHEIIESKEFHTKTRNGPVLIDFFTEWCHPCKIQSKILKENQNELSQRFPELNFYKLNCDRLREIAAKYKIRAIPTLIFFQHGQPHPMSPGVKKPEEITEFIDAHWKNGN
ncbi:MAG: thioredoxin family protein [Promethearchaeia archaeon]